MRTLPYHSWRLAPPLLALAVSAAACGGSGEPAETPTPEPTETPAATVTPAGFLPVESIELILLPARQTVLPATEIFFEQPAEALRWQGPDERVSSRDGFHCGADLGLKRDYGIPDLIVVDDLRSFFAPRSVARSTDWAWTGYSAGDWQLWQGEDANTVYLVHRLEPRAAFEYFATLCD